MAPLEAQRESGGNPHAVVRRKAPAHPEEGEERDKEDPPDFPERKINPLRSGGGGSGSIENKQNPLECLEFQHVTRPRTFEGCW